MLYLAAGMPTVAQLRMMAQTASISCCRSGSLPSMMALPLRRRALRIGRVLLRQPIDRGRRQRRKLHHVERDAVRLAQLAQARQRLDAPAGRVVLVAGVAADVIDAVALEVLEAPRVGRRALAPGDHVAHAGRALIGCRPGERHRGNACQTGQSTNSRRCISPPALKWRPTITEARRLAASAARVKLAARIARSSYCFPIGTCTIPMADQ